MRRQGMTYAAIGLVLGCSTTAAWESVKRAIADIPRDDARALIAMEEQRLDDLEQQWRAILARYHVTVGQNGKVVTLDGRPLRDDGPVMKALDGLLRVSESRRKLLGLNAPTRTEVSGPDGGPIEVTSTELSVMIAQVSVV